MAIEDIGNNTPGELKLNESSRAFLKETAKWAHFLSIVGFVGIGLMVLIAFFGGAFFAYFSNSFGSSSDLFGGAFFTIFYLLFALLYFFPVYYLFKFSGNMKKALQAKDEDTLTKAFEYIKSHYKFIGILTIILLSIYVLVFLFAIIGGAASGL